MARRKSGAQRRKHILSEEPPREGQTCGYQLTHTTWSSRESYCGRAKAEGLYFCAPHDRHIREEYGHVRIAPGNAIGM